MRCKRLLLDGKLAAADGMSLHAAGCSSLHLSFRSNNRAQLVLLLVLLLAVAAACPGAALSNDYCGTFQQTVASNVGFGSSNYCPPCKSAFDKCQPLDMYWANSAVCLLPETLSSYGVQPCGPIMRRPLAPTNASLPSPGTLIMFQAQGRLYVTFQMACPFVLRSTPGSTGAAAYGAGLYIWKNVNFADTPQYVDLFPAPGTYTCLTYSVDLSQVCNPQLSYYSYVPLAAANYGCNCLPNSQPCPPSNLSAAAAIFIHPVVYAATVDDNCMDTAAPYTRASIAVADQAPAVRWSPQTCSLASTTTTPPSPATTASPKPPIILQPADFGQAAPPTPPTAIGNSSASPLPPAALSPPATIVFPPTSMGQAAPPAPPQPLATNSTPPSAQVSVSPSPRPLGTPPPSPAMPSPVAASPPPNAPPPTNTSLPQATGPTATASPPLATQPPPDGAQVLSPAGGPSAKTPSQPPSSGSVGNDNSNAGKPPSQAAWGLPPTGGSDTTAAPAAENNTDGGTNRDTLVITIASIVGFAILAAAASAAVLLLVRRHRAHSDEDGASSVATVGTPKAGWLSRLFSKSGASAGCGLPGGSRQGIDSSSGDLAFNAAPHQAAYGFDASSLGAKGSSVAIVLANGQLLRSATAGGIGQGHAGASFGSNYWGRPPGGTRNPAMTVKAYAASCGGVADRPTVLSPPRELGQATTAGAGGKRNTTATCASAGGVHDAQAGCTQTHAPAGAKGGHEGASGLLDCGLSRSSMSDWLRTSHRSASSMSEWLPSPSPSFTLRPASALTQQHEQATRPSASHQAQQQQQQQQQQRQQPRQELDMQRWQAQPHAAVATASSATSALAVPQRQQPQQQPNMQHLQQRQQQHLPEHSNSYHTNRCSSHNSRAGSNPGASSGASLVQGAGWNMNPGSGHMSVAGLPPVPQPWNLPTLATLPPVAAARSSQGGHRFAASGEGSLPHPSAGIAPSWLPGVAGASLMAGQGSYGSSAGSVGGAASSASSMYSPSTEPPAVHLPRAPHGSLPLTSPAGNHPLAYGSYALTHSSVGSPTGSPVRSCSPELGGGFGLRHSLTLPVAPRSPSRSPVRNSPRSQSPEPSMMLGSGFSSPVLLPLLEAAGPSGNVTAAAAAAAAAVASGLVSCDDVDPDELALALLQRQAAAEAAAEEAADAACDELSAKGVEAAVAEAEGPQGLLEWRG